LSPNKIIFSLLVFIFSLSVQANFSPDSIATLTLWFDASDVDGAGDGATGDPPNSAQVTTWFDKSGGSNNATQATPTNRPLYFVDGGAAINNKPVMRFDGLDDFLATTSLATTINQPNTIFLVIKLNSTSGIQTFVDGLTTGFSNQIWKNASQWRITSGGTALGGGTPDTSPHIFRALFNSSSQFDIDATSIGAGITGTNGLDGIVIGSDYTQAAPFANADFAENYCLRFRFIPAGYRPCYRIPGVEVYYLR